MAISPLATPTPIVDNHARVLDKHVGDQITPLNRHASTMLKRIFGRLNTPGRLSAHIGAVILLFFIFYASTFVVSYGDLLRADDPLI